MKHLLWRGQIHRDQYRTETLFTVSTLAAGTYLILTTYPASENLFHPLISCHMAATTLKSEPIQIRSITNRRGKRTNGSY